MWVFTRNGFYSTVAYDPSKDKEKKSPFKRIAKNKYTHVLVRARVKRDLDALRRIVPNVRVVDDVIADYKYRAVISRRQWKKFLNHATDDIDYDSHFKEVMRAGDPEQGPARYSAVSSVWSAMITLQPVGAWAGAAGDAAWWENYDKNWDTNGWYKSTKDDKITTILQPKDEPTAPVDDSPLTIENVKAYILENKYADYLTDDEVARCTEDGFELWLRVIEERKKLGVSNFNLDDDFLNGLIAEIHADAAEKETSPRETLA